MEVIPTQYGDEYDEWLDGEFRQLTDEEWDMLQKDPDAPWDAMKWLSQERTELG